MKRDNREMVRSGLLPILTLASVVDFGRLAPPPKRLDCPRCHRAKMQGEHGHRYCQGCGYFAKVTP
jgi:hypothetical protein